MLIIVDSEVEVVLLYSFLIWIDSLVFKYFGVI